MSDVRAIAYTVVCPCGLQNHLQGEIDGLRARLDAATKALREIAGEMAEDEPGDCHDANCGHSDAGLGHKACGCYFDSGIYLDHFCGYGASPQRIARRALAVAAGDRETTPNVVKSRMWPLGKSWNVHVTYDDGSWVRITGIENEAAARYHLRDLMPEKAAGRADAKDNT